MFYGIGMPAKNVMRQTVRQKSSFWGTSRERSTVSPVIAVSNYTARPSEASDLCPEVTCSKFEIDQRQRQNAWLMYPESESCQ